VLNWSIERTRKKLYDSTSSIEYTIEIFKNQYLDMFLSRVEIFLNAFLQKKKC
jgi:hypothetical protein